MHSTSVLLVGREKRSELPEALFRSGADFVVRRALLPALEQLRRGRFDAVLVDAKGVDFDVLEFALNVRDVAPDAAIIVVGRPGESELTARLGELPRTHILPAGRGEARLTEAITRILTQRA